MEWDIYSIGDPAFLAESIRAVSAIMANGDFGQLIMIGFLLAALWVAVEGIMSGAKEVKVQNLVIAAVIYAAFFGITVDRVNIWAVDGAYMEEAADVPLGLAVTGSFISTIGKNLTEWFETQFSRPGFSTSSSGNALALKALFKMRDIGFGDGSAGLSWDPGGRLRENLSNYVERCVVVGTRIPEENPGNAPPLDWASIVESEDPWSEMRFRNNLYVTNVYPFDPNYSSFTQDDPQRLGCDDAWQEINTEFVQNDDYIGGIINQLGRSVCAEEVGCPEFESGQITTASDASFNGSAFEDFFRQARDTILQTDVSLDKQLISRAVMGAMVNVGKSVEDLGEGDILVQSIIDRESAQLTTSQALQGTMFERMMGPLMTYFEAFMYVMAPFAALLVTLGAGGLKMIGKYLMFALWIQLWAPVMAVANLYIQMSVTGSMARLQGLTTDAAGAMGTSMESIARGYQSFEVLQHWIGTGGMLLSATPALTLMLIYGSAITASSLAGRVDAAKGADVGMDDFKGQSQMGDAKFSLTQESGSVVAGNDQTQDLANDGQISIKDGFQNAMSSAQAAKIMASNQASQAEGQAATSLSQTASQFTSEDALQKKLESNQQAQQQFQNVEQKALSEDQSFNETEREVGRESLTFAGNIGGEAGANLSDKVSDITGKDVGRDTAALAAGKLSASGSLQGASSEDWVEAVEWAESSKLSESESFSDALSETFSISDSISATEGEKVQDSQAWQNTEQDFQEYREAKTKAQEASDTFQKMENASRTTDAAQQISGSVLKAEMSDPDNLAQYQAYKGDGNATVSDYMNDVRSAVQQGDITEMDNLLGMAGHQVLSGSHDGLEEVGNMRPDTSQADAILAQDRADFEADGRDDVDSRFDMGDYDQLRGDPENLVQMAGFGADDPSDLREDGQAPEGFDNLNFGEGSNGLAEEFYQKKDELGIGDSSTTEEIQNWLASGGMQSAGWGANAGQMAGAIAGGVVSGTVRGAVTGGLAGAVIGGLSGAAISGASHYMEMQEEQRQENQNEILNRVNGAENGWDDAAQMIGDNSELQNFIKDAADSVVYEQAGSMAAAENRGQEWDEQSFKEGLSDFDRQIYENMESLNDQGLINDYEGAVEEAVEKAKQQQEAAADLGDHYSGGRF